MKKRKPSAILIGSTVVLNVLLSGAWADISSRWPGQPPRQMTKSHLTRHPVLVVTQPTSEETYTHREEAMRQLSNPLTHVHKQILFSFLKQSVEQDPLDHDALVAFKNALLNKLRPLVGTDPGLMNALIHVHKNTSHGQVWRDYALQHLALIYKQTNQAAALAPILESIRSQDVTAGTAYLNLVWLADERLELPDHALEQATSSILQMEASSPTSKQLAIKTTGKYKLQGMAAHIQKVADKSENLHLKAIAEKYLSKGTNKPKELNLESTADTTAENLKQAKHNTLEEK